MPDELETILRLVAEGKLTADEAAPIVAALQQRASNESDGPGGRLGSESPRSGRPGEPGHVAGSGRRMRIHVTESGRSVVDLRVPLALAGLATDRVPGLSEANRARIREALDRGLVGPILEVRDEGDEVRIVVE